MRDTKGAYLVGVNGIVNQSPRPLACSGRQTDQFTEPATADHPSKAPQLNARPREGKETTDFSRTTKVERYRFEGVVPRRLRGQYVICFMNGYIVTTESENAPSRMLTVDSEKPRLNSKLPTAPVPVQLGQNRQP